MKERLRIAVLVSGRGSNLQTILDRSRDGSLQVEIAAVVSDQPHPPAFHRVKGLGIPTLELSPSSFPDRTGYDRELARLVSSVKPELVVLAGFMRVVTPVFLDSFRNSVVNIHPALLPSFPGLDAQGQAVAYGVRYSGCTVHFVNEGVDAGPVILQTVVPVRTSDSGESLAARILRMEHLTYPAALQLIAEGRVQIAGRRVLIDLEGRKPLAPRDTVEEWIKATNGGITIE